MSISNSLGFAEWNNKTKINLIDTPGFNMFVHEAKMAMPAVESVIVVVDGVHGRGSLHGKNMAVRRRI